jgi:hypothetical protein
MFFWKKRKKKQKIANASVINLSDIDKRYAKYAKNVRLERVDMESLAAEMIAANVVLKRIYVICRDNIGLGDAQNIVMQAASKKPVLISRDVPLVWCAAYPDERVWHVPLLQLLLGYIKQNEGDAYLKDDSDVIPEEGKYNGHDYLLLALIG